MLKKARVIKEISDLIKESGDKIAEKLIESNIDHRGIEAREEEAITLIHVSNFRPVKRVEDIVYSMCVLTKKVPKANLILVGDGPDRRRVERLVDKLGLKKNVRMMGYRNDIPEILRCADALVMASETESAPLTILEAMSSGLPIIATEVGGIPEQVQDGVNGFLVPEKKNKRARFNFGSFGLYG